MITVPQRIDLIKLLPPGAIVAEVGCWRGYFAIEILNHAPNVAKLFCVDRWQKATSYNDPLSDEDHEANFREAKHHCRGHLPSGRVQFVRGDSLWVAEHDRTIPPLTAVYIDADHSYAACKADLRAWSKRLKPDGVIMGHDYTNNAQAQAWNFGVVRAVDEFCAEEGWEMVAKDAMDFTSYLLQRKGTK